MIIDKKISYSLFGVLFLINILVWGNCLFNSTDENITDKSKDSDIEKLSSIFDIVVADDFKDFKINQSKSLFALKDDERIKSFSAPPWTKLEGKDIRELLGSDGNIDSNLLALAKANNLSLPEIQSKEKKADKLSEVIPYVYSGYAKIKNTGRALIEDRENNISFFRSNGEKFVNYVVMEITPDSLVLFNPESGARIKLLRGVKE